jgi:flavin reductase (DIM6/NTAB) family NADH-FMN oxidoreductase RutF
MWYRRKRGIIMERISISPERVFTPQPMYIIGTKDENNIINFSVKTWISFCWDGFPCIMLCNGGETKTKENILKTKVFSANLVSQNILNIADYLGHNSGQDGQKNKIEYKYNNGKLVDVPIIEDSKWIFECELIKTIELCGSIIIIGKIKNIQIDKILENMDREKIDLKKLDPVIYSPYNYFSINEKIGECGEWNKI